MLLIFFACTDWAAKCRDNDPDVTAAQCWDAGRQTGYQDGYYSAYNSSYEQGLAECEDSYAE